MTHLNKEFSIDEIQDLELEDEVLGTPKLP
jgi:hypothetical protein